MKKYFKTALATLIVSATLFSCSQASKGTYWIDNPTNQEIKVSIDETEYIIPANSGLDVEIEYGKHTLKYNDQSINVFVKSSADKKVIINPTQSNYINFAQLYVVDGTDEETFNKFYEGFIKVNGDSLDFKVGEDTLRMFAPMKVYNNLFIENTVNSWDYALDEAFPSNATIFTDTGEHYQTSKKKIFREKDFWNFFQDGQLKDSGLEIMLVRVPYADLPRFAPDQENYKKVQGDNYKAFLKSYYDSYDEWFSKTGTEALAGPKKLNVIDESAEFGVLKYKYREDYPGDQSFTDAGYEYSNQQVGIAYRFNFLIID